MSRLIRNVCTHTVTSPVLVVVARGDDAQVLRPVHPGDGDEVVWVADPVSGRDVVVAVTKKRLVSRSRERDRKWGACQYLSNTCLWTRQAEWLATWQAPSRCSPCPPRTAPLSSCSSRAAMFGAMLLWKKATTGVCGACRTQNKQTLTAVVYWSFSGEVKKSISYKCLHLYFIVSIFFAAE